MESEVLEQATDEHRPSKVLACYSGGNDSLASTHWAMEHGAHEVLHINTGIGVDEPHLSVEEIVRETCKSRGWPLRVVTPPDLDFRALVLKFGFPGPGAHYLPYRHLKERGIRKVIRETKKALKDRIGLVTGVHRQESARRMGYVEPVVRVGAQLWIAPMWNCSPIEFTAYRFAKGLKPSPISKLLGMSGECLCGAFAKPNEIHTIERLFPKTAEKIHALEAEAKTAGKHCEWGVRPPEKWLDDQFNLPFMPMCVNCHAR